MCSENLEVTKSFLCSLNQKVPYLYSNGCLFQSVQFIIFNFFQYIIIINIIINIIIIKYAAY